MTPLLRLSSQSVVAMPLAQYLEMVSATQCQDSVSVSPGPQADSVLSVLMEHTTCLKGTCLVVLIVIVTQEVLWTTIVTRTLDSVTAVHGLMGEGVINHYVPTFSQLCTSTSMSWKMGAHPRTLQ